MRGDPEAVFRKLEPKVRHVPKGELSLLTIPPQTSTQEDGYEVVYAPERERGKCAGDIAIKTPEGTVHRLTHRQWAFCKYMVETMGNRMQAVRRAYPDLGSRNSASRVAHRLINGPAYKDKIMEGIKLLLSRQGLDKTAMDSWIKEFGAQKVVATTKEGEIVEAEDWDIRQKARQDWLKYHGLDKPPETRKLSGNVIDVDAMRIFENEPIEVALFYQKYERLPTEEEKEKLLAPKTVSIPEAVGDG